MVDSDSGSYGENIRNLKRPYRKTAYQTGYSQKGDAVQSTPLPPHTYSTETTQQTEAIRPGVDAHTFRRPVRPTVEQIDGGTPIAFAFYPWHACPKPESANLIQRQRVNLTTTNVDPGEFIDAVVINVANAAGAGSWVAGIPTAVAFTGTPPPPSLPSQVGIQTDTPGAPTSATQAKSQEANVNPMAIQATGGTTFTPNAATITPGSNAEIYRVATFGHVESLTADASTGVTYEIWIDGTLFMQWVDFQWSPITPLAYEWRFENPLVVEKQIVYRIVNNSGSGAGVGNLTGFAEACFNGWVEQRYGYNDVGYTQLQS
jgi:hypothetical protein